jgi:hypothetical protein
MLRGAGKLRAPTSDGFPRVEPPVPPPADAERRPGFWGRLFGRRGDA